MNDRLIIWGDTNDDSSMTHTMTETYGHLRQYVIILHAPFKVNLNLRFGKKFGHASGDPSVVFS